MLGYKLIPTRVGILFYASLLVLSEIPSNAATTSPSNTIALTTEEEEATTWPEIFMPPETTPRNSSSNVSTENNKTSALSGTVGDPNSTKTMTTVTSDLPTELWRTTTPAETDSNGLMDWLETELIAGITGLSLVLIILAFILGCLTVIAIVCCSRIYRSRKLRREARKRINEVEMRPKKDVEDGIDSSVEDLTESKETPLVQDTPDETTEDDQVPEDAQENMTNCDPQYAMVQRKEDEKKKEKTSKLNQKQDGVVSGNDDEKKCNAIEKEDDPAQSLTGEAATEGVLKKDNDVNQEQVNGSPSIEVNDGYASVSINVICPTVTCEDETNIMTSFKGKPAKTQNEHSNDEEELGSESNKEKINENSTAEEEIGGDNGAQEVVGEDVSQKRLETKL